MLGTFPAVRRVLRGMQSIQETWFWVASGSAGFCAAISMVVVTTGWRRRLPDVGLVGTGLLAISLWALAAGLLGPGPLFNSAPAGSIAVLAGFPFGLVATMPLVSPRTRWARYLARHWQVLASGVTAATVLGIIALLVRPETRVEGPRLGVAVTVVVAAGGLRLAWRQWYLHRVARTRPPAVAAVSIGLLAVVALVAQHSDAGSPVAFAGVVLENAAVFAGSLALLVGYRHNRSLARVLAPIMQRDPLGAFEAGLTPEVRAFVAALDQKDPITRQHVVRTSAMAMRLAERARLSPDHVRSVALGALLHDIGKLVIPSAILNKPTALTDEEFATIKTHSEQGEMLLRGVPGLADVARFVRGHHERPDGRGYPDGLRGDEIDFGVSLVSVCDAWDAMTHTRQYRNGMAVDRAQQIMADGAGRQWHHHAVELLAGEVDQLGTAADPGTLADLSEGVTPTDDLFVACDDALPDPIASGEVNAKGDGESAAGQPSDDLLRRVFEAAPIGMALVCPRGRLVALNEALAELVDHGVVSAGPCLLVQVVDMTAIAKLHHELEALADTDELTGLRNRRGLFRDAQTALEVTSRGAGVAQMVFIDIDGLKAINDTWGHAVGDEMLKAVAAAIRSSTRASEIAARLGGDDFCVLLADAEPGTAQLLAQRIRRDVSCIEVAPNGERLRLTTGVAVADPDRAPNLDELLSKADRALYEQRAAVRAR